MVLPRKLVAALAAVSLSAPASADPVTSYVGTSGATVTLLGPVLLSASISTAPVAPFACDASGERAMHYVRDTDAAGDAGNGGICVCSYVSAAFVWATSAPGLVCPQSP